MIEVTLPAIARQIGLRTVTLATGEAAPEVWLDALQAKMPRVELRQFVEPAFRYTSEQKTSRLRTRIARGVERSLTDAVWFHNPSLARNVPLVEAVNEAVATRGLPAVYHHHDLWVDNRWARWPELRAFGYRSLAQIARIVFPPHVVHATINRLDLGVIRARSNFRASWMPNAIERTETVSTSAEKAAKRWLSEQLGDSQPVWIFPTRFLRRKNLAEAVLLARWLKPTAWVVSTAAVSSKEEARYAGILKDVARKSGWRARFELLANASGDAPEISSLIAASEVVMATSVQEGFGLPCIEAVAAGKPLIARELPNVVPDLRRIGFKLPYLYRDVLIDNSLFDVVAERTRQRKIFARWRRSLPSSVRSLAKDELPSGAIAFSQLTLAGQLEVLAHPPVKSWAVCRKHNPRLRRIEAAVIGGKPAAEEWPARADELLNVRHYAEAFHKALRERPTGDGRESEVIQRGFIEQRLGRDFVFPILIE